MFGSSRPSQWQDSQGREAKSRGKQLMAALRGRAPIGWMTGSEESLWARRDEQCEQNHQGSMGQAGSPRPGQRQGGQGWAANCCALREGGQRLGIIELRGGAIMGAEASLFLIAAIFFCIFYSLSSLRALLTHLEMYIL